MKKLVIDESKWYRGKGSEFSRLRRHHDGKMCCLGFYCLTAGFREDQITGVGNTGWLRPSDINGAITALGSKTGWGYSSSSYEEYMINTNDSRALDDLTRKERLTEAFAQIGWEVEFVPGPVDVATPATVSGDVG